MLSPYSNVYWREKNWPSYLPKDLHFEMGEQPLFAYLTGHARQDPDRPALIFFNREINYREWDEMSNAFAQFLIAAGIQKGDRVALFLPTCPAFAVAYMGILKVGAVVTACSPAFKEWELEYELQDSGAKILVYLDEYMDTVRPVFPKVALEKVVVTGLFSLPGRSGSIHKPAPGRGELRGQGGRRREKGRGHQSRSSSQGRIQREGTLRRN